MLLKNCSYKQSNTTCPWENSLQKTKIYSNAIRNLKFALKYVPGTENQIAVTPSSYDKVVACIAATAVSRESEIGKFLKNTRF